jgi:hypothetical protein
MSRVIQRFDVPIQLRKSTTLISAQFYDVLEVYDTKLVAYNNGKEVVSWLYKDFINVLIEEANLNSQFARIVFVTSASGNKKDSMISLSTNLNIVGDINKIVFCSGMFSYRPANSYAMDFFNVLYSAFKSYRENDEPQKVSTLNSSADELKKFADLFREGLITESEYEAKKKQILGL